MPPESHNNELAYHNKEAGGGFAWQGHRDDLGKAKYQCESTTICGQNAPEILILS